MMDHCMVYGGSKFRICWKSNHDGLVVESFDIDAEMADRKWPTDRDAGGELLGAAVLDDFIFVAQSKRLLWKPLEENRWDEMPLPDSYGGALRLRAGRLYVERDGLLEIDHRAKKVTVLSSERTGKDSVGYRNTNPWLLCFVDPASPGKRSGRELAAALAHLSLFLEMARQGELAMGLDPQVAAWMALKVRRGTETPENYRPWPARPVIPGLGPVVLENACCAAADPTAIWIVFRDGDGGFKLARVPLDGSAPSEAAIATIQHPDQMLVSPEHVVVYNSSTLPTAVYSKAKFLEEVGARR